MKKKLWVYIAIAFGWSWVCWIGAYSLARINGFQLSTQGTMFDLFNGTYLGSTPLAQIIFAIAVYGPMIGFLVVGGISLAKNSTLGMLQKIIILVGIPLLYSIPVIVISLLSGYAKFTALDVAVKLVILYLISNFLTSGTEELGWRGFLYPYLKEKSKSFWDVSFKTGLIWAAWHFPILFIMYSSGHPSLLISAVIGFTVSIVAMSYITNFVYEKTNSLPLTMLFHALNNTFSFIVTLLFAGTPFMILTNISVWVIVWIIEKKYISKDSTDLLKR